MINNFAERWNFLRLKSGKAGNNKYKKKLKIEIEVEIGGLNMAGHNCDNFLEFFLRRGRSDTLSRDYDCRATDSVPLRKGS